MVGTCSSGPRAILPTQAKSAIGSYGSLGRRAALATKEAWMLSML